VAGGKVRNATLSSKVIVLLAASLLLANYKGDSPSFVETWPSIRDVNLALQRGSPLDFSAAMRPGPAGIDGPVKVGTDGHLHYGNGDRARFHCGTIALTRAAGGYPDHATSDMLALQMRMHGYNAVRIHFLDAALIDHRSRDFDFDPEQLERFRYFLAAVKRQGIYWVIDAMSSWNGAMGNTNDDQLWRRPGHDIDFRVYFDPVAQSHWRRMVDSILGSVNPYTGTTPLHDPALAMVIFINENNMTWMLQREGVRKGMSYPSQLEPGFLKWARGRPLSRNELGVPIMGEGTARETLFRRYLVDLQLTRYREMQAYLRKQGFNGPVSGYDAPINVDDSRARGAFEVVDMHQYHDLVQPKLGATMKQVSSLAPKSSFAQEAAASRWLGKPFTLTEYSIPYWSRFRYEAGATIGAYAAFQDWDLICQRGATPIDLSYGDGSFRKRTLFPASSTGLDPVQRAGETLAWFLFYRGDVAPASHAIGLDIDPAPDGTARISPDFQRLGFVTGIGLFANRPPSGTISVIQDGMPGRVYPAIPVFASQIARLRASGVLRQENRTNESVYQAETGQLLLDSQALRLHIVTPRTEALSFVTLSKPIGLRVMTIEAADSPATISISSLDGKPITSSGRFLLTMATDALATGVRFADEEHHTILNFGKLPVQVRPGLASIRLTGLPSGRYRLRALRLDGRFADEVPIIIRNGILRFSLNNITSFGPTTFWYLSRST